MTKKAWQSDWQQAADEKAALEEYARRMEDHFIALATLKSPEEEYRARATINAERLVCGVNPRLSRS